MQRIEPIRKSSYDGVVGYKDNPMPHLYKERTVVKVGQGLFVLKSVLAELFIALNEKFSVIAKKTGVAEIIVPAMLSPENYTRSQYLDSFSNQALMVLPASEKKVDNLHGMNSPTVCYHYFSSWQMMSFQKILESQAQASVLGKKRES